MTSSPSVANQILSLDAAQGSEARVDGANETAGVVTAGRPPEPAARQCEQTSEMPEEERKKKTGKKAKRDRKNQRMARLKEATREAHAQPVVPADPAPLSAGPDLPIGANRRC